MNTTADSIHPAVLRYARGDIPASRAVDLLGPDATLHDLLDQLRTAGIEPPRPPREIELAELDRARRLLGMAPKSAA